MKKILALMILAAVVGCDNQDQKDEATNLNVQKITVDVVAVDNDGTETTSATAWATLPK